MRIGDQYKYIHMNKWDLWEVIDIDDKIYCKCIDSGTLEVFPNGYIAHWDSMSSNKWVRVETKSDNFKIIYEILNSEG